jgi:uroporphyrinogen decarboxylase
MIETCAMNSRERVLMALDHAEPDRVPLDIGGTAVSAIHRVAYAALRRHLDLPEQTIRISNLVGQTAHLDEDFLERLQVDTRFVAPRNPATERITLRDEGAYWTYEDEWGIGRRQPKDGGLYFDIVRHPFDVDDVIQRWQSYAWPDATDPKRFTTLKEQTLAAREKGKLVVLGGLCAGIAEMYSWLRGYTRFYTDLAAEPKTAHMFLEKLVELKVAYWERALALVGPYVDVVTEADDLAGQQGLLISPETYRRVIKPWHRELFQAIKRTAPHVKLFLHSCGAVRPLIPDFIEVGVDILNPVQISARGMDPVELKREFGKELVFWGGGVDTQNVLGNGMPQAVRDHVRRNIEALAPGGGFVFATVHNTQANVPPQNFMAMWETLQEYGIYNSI